MTSASIISNICGGLGNQMFQYAAGRALALRCDASLQLDISWFNDMDGCTPRTFQMPLFPALAPATPIYTLIHSPIMAKYRRSMSLWMRAIRRVKHLCFPDPMRCVFQNSFDVDSRVLQAVAPTYLYGYWQSAAYFEDFSDVIRKDLTFPPLPTQAAQQMASLIHGTHNSVAVHVRRGDYIKSAEINAVHGTCKQDYYHKSIDTIAQQSNNLSLFIFSDDPQWVRECFEAYGYPFTVVDLHAEAQAIHDMHLMSLCKHHIIANSSFSWWGAWLSSMVGITCAPKRWLANGESFDSIHMPNWYIL